VGVSIPAKPNSLGSFPTQTRPGLNSHEHDNMVKRGCTEAKIAARLEIIRANPALQQFQAHSESEFAAIISDRRAVHQQLCV
jgi:hypothetical protein